MGSKCHSGILQETWFRISKSEKYGRTITLILIDRTNKKSHVSLIRYPDNCPPRKIAPRLGWRFGLELVLGLGGYFPWG